MKRKQKQFLRQVLPLGLTLCGIYAMILMSSTVTLDTLVRRNPYPRTISLNILVKDILANDSDFQSHRLAEDRRPWKPKGPGDANGGRFGADLNFVPTIKSSHRRPKRSDARVKRRGVAESRTRRVPATTSTTARIPEEAAAHKWSENVETGSALAMHNVAHLWPGESTLLKKVDKNRSHTDTKLPPFVSNGQAFSPGYRGKAYRLEDVSLSRQQKKARMLDFDVNYFDTWVSDRIPVHRPLPDDRSDRCKYKIHTDLPTASVLIVFHNEAWTTLLRTIHSVLDTTRPELMQEVILLDDFSDQDHLKEPLEKYIHNLTQVHLYRAQTRLGLIRARNEIFSLATTDVVVFLDSHIECFPGWLEPLLTPIKDDQRTVVYPTIEYINPGTFNVQMSSYPKAVGGLKLDTLQFQWMYRKFVNTSQEYVESPTMPGGLYAISRDWFSQLGRYDPGMDFWGGENLEISFKAWMCGGSILVSTCSHVGHIFRRVNPNIKGVALGYKNSVRLAEVWMDSFKHFFYEAIAYTVGNFGDVNGRVALRQSLMCKPFAWYLDKVFPELRKEIWDYGNYTGLIEYELQSLCVDRKELKKVVLSRCSSTSFNQQWRLSSKGHLVSGERLIGLPRPQKNKTSHLRLFRQDRITSAGLVWSYDEETRHLAHVASGQCLHADPIKLLAELKPCGVSLLQRWQMITRTQRHLDVKRQGVLIDWTV